MADKDNSYLTVDFGFRRGSKKNLNSTDVKNGTLNFTKDTKELFVDIDDKRIQITSIVFDGGTEDDIKALENPDNKIYLSSDTFKLLYFDPKSLEWHTVTGENIDFDKYYTKAQVNSLLDNIKDMINQLQETHNEDIADINADVDYVQNNYLLAHQDDITMDFNDETTDEDLTNESEETT